MLRQVSKIRYPLARVRACMPIVMLQKTSILQFLILFYCKDDRFWCINSEIFWILTLHYLFLECLVI